MAVLASKSGFWPECLGRGPDRPLIARGEGTQRVLHPVAELARDLLRDVDRVLGDEIDPDALRADQANDLLDFVEQGLGASSNSKCASSKKNTRFGFSGSPTSGSASNSSDSSHSRNVA